MDDLELTTTYDKAPLIEAMKTSMQQKGKEYKEAELYKDKTWIEASSLVYKMKEGKDFQGYTEDLAQYGIDKMSEFNYNISFGMVPDVLDVEDADHDTQVAFAYMMDTYDKKDVTIEGFGRAAKELALDPTSYVGIGTLGVGFAVKKSAQEVAKQGLKNRLMAKISSYLTNEVAIGATEGALYTAGDEVARESVYQDAGMMDGYSPENIAIAGGLGAVAGGGIVKGVKMVGKGIDMANKAGEEAMAISAGGGTPPNYIDIKPNTKETIKLYRGTSDTGAGGGEALVGKGLYLTPNADTAKKYGSRVEEVEVKNENIYDATATMTDKEYKEFVKLFRGQRGIEYMPNENIGYTYEFLKDDIGANTGLDYEEVAEKMNTLIKKKGFEGMMFDLSRVTDSTQEGEKAFLLFNKKETK